MQKQHGVVRVRGVVLVGDSNGAGHLGLSHRHHGERHVCCRVVGRPEHSTLTSIRERDRERERERQRQREREREREVGMFWSVAEL